MKFPRLITALAAGAMLVGLSVSPAQAAPSPIEQRYQSDSELRALLGPSTGNEYSVENGRVHHYANGSLFWTQATGVKEVHGAIRARYFQIGGPTKFGWPTTDQTDVVIREEWGPIGAANDFEDGTIAWSEDYGAVSMSTPVADEWRDNLYPFLYMPHANEKPIGAGTVLDFGDNDIYWCSSCNGAHVVNANHWGTELEVAQKWFSKGGATGFLGLPTSDLQYRFNDEGTEGTFQRFKGGIVMHKGDPMGSAYSAHEIHGAILSRWQVEGGLNGLGWPVSDEVAIPGGKASYFEKGYIRWTPSQGTSVTYY